MDGTGRSISVADNPDASRYELRVDGSLAGFITYRERPGRLAMIHAEVFPEFEGRGMGSRLAAGALDDVRSRGLRVLPLCPFVVDFLAHHSEYDDLVAGGA